MAAFHYVHLRAFAHETEDPERVREAVRRAAQSEKQELGETQVEGSHKNRIRILEADLKNAASARRMFLAFAKADPRGFARVAAEADRRMDENLNFYFRLDKQEAYLGRLALTDGDDAITVRAKIKSYQSRKSDTVQAEALATLTGFLRDVGERAQALD